MDESLTGSAIATTGDHAFFGTARGRVLKLDLATFTVATTLQVPGTSPLSIQAGFSDHTDTYVYFRTSDARLLRIRQTDLTLDASLQLSSDMGPKGPTALIDPQQRASTCPARPNEASHRGAAARPGAARGTAAAANAGRSAAIRDAAVGAQQRLRSDVPRSRQPDGR